MIKSVSMKKNELSLTDEDLRTKDSEMKAKSIRVYTTIVKLQYRPR